MIKNPSKTTNNALNNKIGSAYEAISLFNKTAYTDLFMISNEILSKSPFNNKFFDHYLSGEEPSATGVWLVFYKIVLYYIKSTAHFISYLARFIEYLLSGYRPNLPASGEELVVVDTVFFVEKIINDNNFSEMFMPGISDVLIREAKSYAYLPLFYSRAYGKKPFEILRTMKILMKKEVPVLCEFYLLNASDLLLLTLFIAAYPFRLLRLSRRLKSGIFDQRVLKYELLRTIDNVTFYSFSRYLQGRRVAKLPYRKIKVISWYENKPIYKNFYKGLRINWDKVSIYGAQLFLYSKHYLTLIPDENEQVFGVVPDKIISNGSYYMPNRSKLNYALGPSLRYAKIFSTKLLRENQRDILVLLPYPIDNGISVLNILSSLGVIKNNVNIKAHPGLDISKLPVKIPSNVKVRYEDVYKLFETTKMIVGSSSGTLIEAASLGIPVISVRTDKRFDYHNPLPE